MVRSGFTLLETLIYVVLFAIVMGVLSSIFLSSVRTNQITRHEHTLLQAGRLAELRIRDALSQAGAVTSPASGTATTLTVDGASFPGGPVSFFVTDGVLYIQEGAAPAAAITPSTVDVIGFEATRTGSAPPGITVSFTMETQTPDALLSHDSAFTVILRYE